VKIKVLGPGCPKCQKTADNVKQAVSEAGSDASVDKVTDVMEIAKLGIFTTPAVVIDGDVKAVGKVPSVDEIKDWLSK